MKIISRRAGENISYKLRQGSQSWWICPKAVANNVCSHLVMKRIFACMVSPLSDCSALCHNIKRATLSTWFTGTNYESYMDYEALYIGSANISACLPAYRGQSWRLQLSQRIRNESWQMSPLIHCFGSFKGLVGEYAYYCLLRMTREDTVYTTLLNMEIQPQEG